MKKITMFLILLCCCSSYAQLEEEGFEGVWTSGSGPAGWLTLQNNLGLSVTWAQSIAGNDAQPPKNGLHAAYLNSQNVTGSLAEDYLITPEFTVPAENAELIFWSRMTMQLDQGSIYKVLIADITEGADPMLIASYQELLPEPWTELVLNPSQTEYNKIVVSIPAAYTNKNVRIAFMMAGDDQERWLIDDVKVAAHCLEPSALSAGNFGLTSASLDWTDSSGGTAAWEVAILFDYIEFNGTGGVEYDGPLPYPATGLSENTDYKYYIRALCDGGGESEWVGPVYFNTAASGETCEAPLIIDALPFSTTGDTAFFEDFYEGDGCSASASGYLNGNNVVYAYTPDTSGTISINVSGLSPSNPYSAVFVYTSCDAIGTDCYASAFNDFFPYPLSLSPLPVTAGTTYYIVISTADWAMETTDFTLNVQEENCTPPASLQAGTVTEASVSLSWTEAGSATSWEYVVQLPGAGVPSGTGTVSATPDHIETGLAAGDERELYVRSVCGDGTYSSWSGPFHFATLCGPLDLPFSEGFNSDSETKHCWKTVDVNNDAYNDGVMDYNKWFLDWFDAPYEGDYSTLFYTDALATDDWLISPTVNLDGNQRLRFRYRVSSPISEGDLQMFLSTTGNDVEDFTIAFGPENYTGNSAEFIEVLVNIVDGTNSPYSGPVNIGWHVAPGTLPDGYLYIQLDNVVIENIPACADPQLSTIGTGVITSTTAELTWTPGFDETQWQVVIQEPGIGYPLGGEAELATINPYLATGLEPATDYEYYIKSECGIEGEGNWVGPFGFATECSTYNIPFHEGFNTGSPSKRCWTVLNADGSEDWYSWYMNSTDMMFVFEGDQGVKHNNDPNDDDNNINDWLISPAINLTGEPAQRLKFHCPAGAQNYELLLSTTGTNPEDFTTVLSPVPTGNNEGPNHVEIIAELTDSSNIPVSGMVYIAWHIGPGEYNYADVYIDNVVVATCFDPNNLTAADITDTTAALSWQPGYEEEGWLIVVQPKDTGVPSGGGEAVGDTQYLAENLDPATHYEYYVKADCGINWSGPYYFDTKVCNPAGQCNYIFTMANTMDNGQGWYGNTMSVKQNGFTVATLIGPTLYQQYADSNWINVETVEIPLCPGIPFELIWDEPEGAGYPYGLAVAVHTPYLEEIYSKPAGGQATGDPVPGDLLYTGMVSCDPPACPKPQNLNVSGITSSSALLEWDETGSAGSWEVWAIPLDTPVIPIPLLDYQYYGFPVPVLPVPDTAETDPVVWDNPSLDYGAFGNPVLAVPFSGPGIVVAENPYTLNGLTPGTHYAFYVKAICGGDESSTLSGPDLFTTLITNDACENAITLPVNPGWDCTETVYGTINGSTSVIEPQYAPTYDVWYKFVAGSDIHTVSILNTFGTFVYFQAYEGEGCGNLTELQTVSGTSRNYEGLTVGATYWVRVYMSSYSPPNMSGFDMCVSTPQRPITVSDEYTMQELVENVLIGNTCIATVSNVTSIMGSDFGDNPLSIGYFNAEDSYFPIKEGIALATGNLNELPGYWGNTPFYFQDFNWPGDDELTDILNDAIDNPYDLGYYNASVLEFDFVPTTGEVNFDFVFASDEYHQARQCSVADGMAIILTGPDGIPHNIGVIPETETPVSVVTIREQSEYYYTGPCLPMNAEFFGSYNGPEATGPYYQTSQPPSGINHYGQTIKMQAHSDVVPGDQYHIKFVIANFQMPRDNSALFVSGFKMDQTDLGPDLMVDLATALCPAGEQELQTGLDPDKYVFEWLINDEVIQGATNADYIVSEAGEYTVNASLIGIGVDCIVTDTILIEYYDPLQASPANLELCSPTATATFDLLQNTDIILEGLNANDYTITYHLTEAQAIEDEAPLALSYTNATPSLQTIYVRIENEIAGCISFGAFDLIVKPSPAFEISPDFSICGGTTGTITVNPSNFNGDEAGYTWTKNNEPLLDSLAELEVSEGGDYTVTVNSNGCTSQASVTVTVTPAPAVDDPDDVVACHSYVLPALTEGNTYTTGPDGTGILLYEGQEITQSQTIYVYAESGTVPKCTAQNSFDITITPLTAPITVFTLPDSICKSDANLVAVPAEGFTVGGSYTADNGLIINSLTGEINVEASAPGIYTVTYAVVENSVNCIASGFSTVSVTITEGVTPVTGFEYEVAYCFGTGNTAPQLVPGFSAGGNFTSSEGLIIDQVTGSINVALSVPGTYTVTYTINPDNAACNAGGVSSDSFTISGELSFSLEGQCEDNDFYITAIPKDGSFDTVVFEWVNAEGQRVGYDSERFNVTDYVNASGEHIFPLEFILTVISNGCESSEIYSVDGVSCFIQRGISPNNDGSNDSFDLSGLDVNNLIIFNRYGKEAYSRNNYINEWQGQSNDGDELPTGTYYYVITLNNGETKTGWIYINREE